VLLFDKTGTLTSGHPNVRRVVTPSGEQPDRVLRLAASLDQASAHVLASAVVRAARERGLPLALPLEVQESPGAGVSGTVDGVQVRVGTRSFVAPEARPWMRALVRRAALDGSLLVFVAVVDQPVGALVLSDPVRSEAPRMVRELRAAGFTRVVMVTGDHREVAESVGAAVGRRRGARRAVARGQARRRPCRRRRTDRHGR
jgi:P-type E1-E2 ATPase